MKARRSLHKTWQVLGIGGPWYREAEMSHGACLKIFIKSNETCRSVALFCAAEWLFLPMLAGKLLAQQILNCRLSNMTESRRQMLYRDPLPLLSMVKADSCCVWLFCNPFPTLKKEVVGFLSKESKLSQRKTPHNLKFQDPPTKWLVPSWSLCSETHPGTGIFLPPA